MTLILLAVSLSVISCNSWVLGHLRHQGLPRLENDVLLSGPRQAHPSRVPVVALVVTGLALEEIPQQRGSLEGTRHPVQILLPTCTWS